MKKFALIFVVLLAISCSDDDSSSGTSGADLKTMVTSLYGVDGGLMDRTVMDFDDNKPSHYKVYTPMGQLSRSIDYAYGNDGQLKTLSVYNMQGRLGFTENFSYDSLGRLVKLVWQDHDDNDEMDYGNSIYEYIYNSDNTITRKISGNTFGTYYLNANGQVYKIEHPDGYTSEVVYVGNDIVSWTQGGNSIYYFYDNVTPVKGEYRNIFRNQFRGYEANHVLYGGHVNAVTATPKYITHQQHEGGNTVHYGYQFNDAGYPVRISSGINEDEPNVFVDLSYQ